MDEPHLHKQIRQEERELAIVTFLLVHPYERCGDSVEVRQDGRTISCCCSRCGVYRTYQIVR